LKNFKAKSKSKQCGISIASSNETSVNLHYRDTCGN